MALFLKGKKVLIIGLGQSGLSVLQFLSKEGAKAYGVDDAFCVLKKACDLSFSNSFSFFPLTCEEAIKKMAFFDYVIVSPGISKSHPCYSKALAQKITILGEVELACRLLQDKTCIGITGTNGKTTVTYLIEHILNKCGIAAKAVGNCGLPLMSLFNQDENIEAFTHLVIELSSFQLETLSTKILDYGIILNITPDHLDRYDGMKQYSFAKFNLFNCVKQFSNCYIEEKAIKLWTQELRKDAFHPYGYDPSSQVYTDLHYIYYKNDKVGNLPFELCGKKSHDLENFLAAFAVVKNLGISFGDFAKAFASFKKPPHRIEFVADVAGVSFVNDSKGTNVDAVCRAVESMPSSVILIAGGVDKGFSYTCWNEVFKGKVKAVFAIGQAASNIAADLAPVINVKMQKNLQEAVLSAWSIAKKGDTILLSPGCASYDQFVDYAHRGSEFKKIVNVLVQEHQNVVEAKKI